jgi:hypothetical protein
LRKDIDDLVVGMRCYSVARQGRELVERDSRDLVMCPNREGVCWRGNGGGLGGRVGVENSRLVCHTASKTGTMLIVLRRGWW